ncbi:MAG: hypothetical protein LBD79_01745 [Treponema sp.]|nr:hypothetical protein [Treponema sp.]
MGNNITLQGKSGNNAAPVKVNNGGIMVMEPGSKISNNTSSDHGGVFNWEKFTMNRGEISNNNASNDGAGIQQGYLYDERW